MILHHDIFINVDKNVANKEKKPVIMVDLSIY
jgi:hypothetical protein